MGLSISQVEAIEGGECDLDYFLALQQAINDLTPWKFQGSYGRSMMGAIESGCCMLGKESTSDYWGNYIPSRDEVQAGTKGSREYVAENRGEQWANLMEEL